jgi:hypothetical protein
MSLTIKKAQPLIVAEWCDWAKQHGSYDNAAMLDFHFGWLSKNRPDLLLFKCHADKWQVVHGWIQRYEHNQSRSRPGDQQRPFPMP